MLRVALLVGGPSAERAISLNSGRSVADHLEGPGIAIEPIVYFDRELRPYSISRKMLYSNTPDDFDFKLSQTARPLSSDQLRAALAGSDLAVPVMHGVFGEDGQVQGILSDLGVPYVGSDPEACRRAYDKYLAHDSLEKAGIAAVPSLLFTPDGTSERGEGSPADRSDVAAASVVVLKPAEGGSSLGVRVVEKAPGELLTAATPAVREQVDAHGRVVAQPFVRGIELTTVVVEGPSGPVALLPVEVELRNRRSAEDILSFRHKYLPSDNARYHCPPRLSDETVAAVRRVAVETFAALGLRDFARIDCWYTDDERVVVADINPISGMEQNSFLFIQAAQVGMTHADVLRLVLAAAGRRYGIELPIDEWKADGAVADRMPVPVILGGDTAERQVSVLSGTNVWLKLLRSDRFEPRPYLLEGTDTLWELTYPTALRHSVEQILDACRSAADVEPRRRRLADEIAGELGLEAWQRSVPGHIPTRLSLDEFLPGQRFVFIALHGGFGEDGTLQAKLDAHGVAYNGCDPDASALCMDKMATGDRLAGRSAEGIRVAAKVVLDPKVLAGGAEDEEAAWARLVEQCGAPTVVVKPVADGCSAGVVPLASGAELRSYVEAIAAGATQIEAGVFSRLASDQVVEMPVGSSSLIAEAFVATDSVTIVGGAEASGGTDGLRDEAARLEWGTRSETEWIEVTVGVLGRQGEMRALSPSLTIAREGVLSVEEKFMGGTGVNITPPPPPPLGRVAPEAVVRTRELIGKVANLLGIRGYSRIDAFMHRESGEVIVIEANSLPGLTPATVFYHQALEEDVPMFPRTLLETIIDLGLEVREGVAGAGTP